jgi:uncharacterized protein (DUF58 family)
MKKESTYPKDIFVHLPDLLRMEGYARGFSFLAKKQKVRSVLGGKHASKLRGRGMDFEEVRNYVPGDDIRNIDWKVTARTQVTHSKVFSEEKEKPALIIVDQSRSMFFGSQVKTKSVVAAEVAALAAFKIQKEGDRVGGMVYTEEGIDVVLPKRNKKNTLLFLERMVYHNHKLAEGKVGERQETLSEAMRKVKNIVTHDYLVIVISDFKDYSDRVIKYLSGLAQHNDLLLVKVSDPFERDIPKEKMIFGDGTKQLAIQGHKKQVQQKFQEGFDAGLKDFEAKMLKHRIPVFHVNTVDLVDEQIKNLFR